MDYQDRALNTIGEKILETAINVDFVRYCPTMDLLAIATIDECVHVLRFNGQQVFEVAQRQHANIHQVVWKPNGQSLAVAFSNHVIFLTNVNTGKTMHQLDCMVHSPSSFSCLGWGVNFSDSTAVRKRIEVAENSYELDDLLRQGPDTKSSSEAPDLPAELAFLDVESCLPKLSLLVSSGSDDDIFSSRASLDALFKPLQKGLNDSADVLVIGFDDGTVHLSVHDFFNIGNFNVQKDAHLPPGSKVIRHASHPLCTTHGLLVSVPSSSSPALYFLPLDLRLIATAGRYLSLLAAKSTQLHNILRYVSQVQQQMFTDFKASQDLPHRFMANLDEALAENHDCNWVQAAYHLLATGHCFQCLREWLSQDIGERNFKRWDKAVTTGYETIRRLVHECLLPALERMTVLISRLRGLSRFHDSNLALGLNTQELDDILDTNQTLQLLAHHILRLTIAELRQYSAFSVWLHREIDIQSSDDGSAAQQESLDREISIDHATTLQYIQGAMCHSRLAVHLQVGYKENDYSKWKLSAGGRSLYELYGHELKEMEAGTERTLPGLDSLIPHMSAQCEKLFTRIAETQRRNVRFGNPIVISSAPCVAAELRVSPEAVAKDAFNVHILSTAADGDARVQINEVSLRLENGVSAIGSHTSSTLSFPGQTLKDIKFIDDEEIMLALSDEASSRLIRIPYRDGKEPGRYHDIADSVDTNARISIVSSDALKEFEIHRFAAGPAGGIERCEINGKKGRRAMCAVACDKIRYQVLDIDPTETHREDMEAAVANLEH